MSRLAGNYVTGHAVFRNSLMTEKYRNNNTAILLSSSCLLNIVSVDMHRERVKNVSLHMYIMAK